MHALTQHAEPHHAPRFADPRAEPEDHWTPPELPDQPPVEQQPDPERADWMPPLEHRPPSILEGPSGDHPVRHDPTATMLPPTDPTGGPPPAEPVTGAIATIDPLWPDAEVARFEGRWRDVQLGFVDDPRHAADEARTLLDEVVDRLTRASSDRGCVLDPWRTDGKGRGTGPRPADTEAMLSAVRRYRRLMDQLLAVGQ